MSNFTPEQEKEFEFRARYEQEQAAAQQQQDKQEDQETAVNRARAIGVPAGAVLGAGTHLAGKTADVGRFLTGQKNEAPGFYGKGAPPMERYGRAMNLQNTGEQKWFGGKEMNEIYDRMRQAHKDPVLAAQYEKEALGQMKPVRRAGEKIATAVPQSMRGVLTNPMGFLGKTVMGAGAGMQAADAAARYGNDDTSGAIISGIGALGTAASMIPHPVARVGGTAVGMGAEGLNMFLDKLKNKKQMAKGGLVDEEDGLCKAEKAALRIMKKKQKKVKKLADGGLAGPLGGVDPALAANSSSPFTTPIPANDPTTGVYQQSNNTAPLSSGLSSLFSAFGKSANPTAPAQVGDQQGPVAAEVNPYAGQPINMSVMGGERAPIPTMTQEQFNSLAGLNKPAGTYQDYLSNQSGPAMGGLSGQGPMNFDQFKQSNMMGGMAPMGPMGGANPMAPMGRMNPMAPMRGVNSMGIMRGMVNNQGAAQINPTNAMRPQAASQFKNFNPLRQRLQRLKQGR